MTLLWRATLPHDFDFDLQKKENCLSLNIYICVYSMPREGDGIVVVTEYATAAAVVDGLLILRSAKRWGSGCYAFSTTT